MKASTYCEERCDNNIICSCKLYECKFSDAACCSTTCYRLHNC